MSNEPVLGRQVNVLLSGPAGPAGIVAHFGARNGNIQLRQAFREFHERKRQGEINGDPKVIDIRAPYILEHWYEAIMLALEAQQNGYITRLYAPPGRIDEEFEEKISYGLAKDAFDEIIRLGH